MKRAQYRSKASQGIPTMAKDHATETYGIGHIPFTLLKEQIDNVGGEITIKVIKVLNPVVQGSKKDLGEKLVFAIFYKNPDGKYFDAVQKHDGKRKLFMDAEVLTSTLAKMQLLDDNITIPLRTEQNLIHFDSLK